MLFSYTDKMAVPLTIFVLLSVLEVLTAVTVRDSPFGTIPNCTINSDKAAVICNHAKLDNTINPFNQLKYWWNDKNESFPYTSIRIHHCALSRIYQIPAISGVKILNLSHNRIQVIEKAAFQNLQNMTELDLSNNGLYSEMLNPNIFEGIYAEKEYLPLKSMKVLRLAVNSIHTLHQNTFEHIEKLEILDLRENPFKLLDAQTSIAISGLIYLKELDLSFTSLTKIPDNIFHGPSRHLRLLQLTGNLFTTIPQQIGEAINLEELNLNENPILTLTNVTGVPSSLKKLRILHLCYMPNLTMIGEESLSGLESLEELYITNNNKLMYFEKNVLTFKEPNSEIELWPKIKKLRLERNQLTHLEHNFISRWDQLEEMEIFENPWSCDCDNEWMIRTLVEYMAEKKDPRLAELTCGGPVEMEGKSLLAIHNSSEILRCLDLNGARPERDAGIMIGILIGFVVGLLLGIPLVLGVLYCYKRNWFGFFENGPAAFSRKFYNRAESGEEGVY